MKLTEEIALDASRLARNRHVVASGQTPVLDPAEAHGLLDSIDTATLVGLRDRALIGLMVNLSRGGILLPSVARRFGTARSLALR